jgi:hypothetical protein
MLINYLDPETLLNLKATLPDLMINCKPEYPHVEHLPGLTFAYKSKCYLVKKGGKGSRLLSKFNSSPNEKHPQRVLYEDVVVMALEKHTPYSYQSKTEETVFDIAYQTSRRDPLLFPYVKPGDVFSKLQTGSTEGYHCGRIDILPSVVFANSAGRMKYHCVQVAKSVKEALGDYKNLSRMEKAYSRPISWIISDISFGLVRWDYPFNFIMLTRTEICAKIPEIDAMTGFGDKYTTQEIREFCVNLELPSTGTLLEMCKRILTFLGFEN